MLRGDVNRRRECGILPGNAGDVDNVFRTAVVAVAQEMCYRQLRRADGVCDVDIYQGVSATSGRVLAGRRARWAPEVTPVLSIRAVGQRYALSLCIRTVCSM